jgi:hypothetical protein
MNRELTMERAGKYIAYSVALFLCILFLVISLKRVFFPYELEWMEGSIIDHVLRIFHGKPLYTEPSIYFTNWLYQPLYYYITSAVMSFTEVSYLPGRLVSECSVILSGLVIFFGARALAPSSMFYALIAPALYIGTYALTGYSFDIARIDSLLVLFLLSSVCIFTKNSSLKRSILSAILMACAIFTKQQAFLYTLPIVFWLLINNRKYAYAFIITLILSFTIGTFLLWNDSGSWYFYYVYTIPAAKANGFGWFRTLFVIPDYLLSHWAIGMVVFIISLCTLKGKVIHWFADAHGLIALVFLTSILQLSLHLGDQMSYLNVAMPFAAFFALSYISSIGKLSPLIADRWKPFIPWVICLQLLAFIYNPFREDMVVIHDEDILAGKRFIDTLSSVRGNVLLSSHSFLPTMAGKTSYANELACSDVLAVGDKTSVKLKSEWENAFRTHFFDIVIKDAGVFSLHDSVEHYSECGSLNMNKPIFRSRIGSFTTAPRYIYCIKHENEIR